MPILSAARTHVGKVRQKNEDAWGGFTDLNFYVVADGMGGHAGGEIASTLVVETMQHSLHVTQDEDLTPIVDESGHYSIGGRRLLIAIQQANTTVRERAEQDAQLTGMGSTVAALLFTDQEVSVSHIGDSRVYLIRSGQIKQLTEDHSLVQQLIRDGTLTPDQAETSPYRHILTQAIGIHLLVQPSLRVEQLQPADVFLLCSDGIHGVVKEEEVLQLVMQAEGDLPQTCDRLIDLANTRGGRDNSTAMILQYDA